MFIDGKWYSEPEIICLVHRLKDKIKELETNQEKETVE